MSHSKRSVELRTYYTHIKAIQCAVQQIIQQQEVNCTYSKVNGTTSLLPPLKILLLQVCQRINSYELVSRSLF